MRMITKLHQQLSSISETWESSEDTSTFTVKCNDCTADDCEQIIAQVDELRAHFDGRGLIFYITHERDIFEFRLQWEPSGNVVSISESDSGTDSHKIFTDESVASALESLRNNRINTISEVQDCLDHFSNDEQVRVSFKYRIDTNQIASALSDFLNKSVEVMFYFNEETFLDQLEDCNLYEITDLLAPENEKRMIVFFETSGSSYGATLGLFSMQDLDSDLLEDFVNTPPVFTNTMNKVGRECAIDEFEQVFLPPNILKMNYDGNSELTERSEQITLPFKLIWAIFATSNIVRNKDDGWEIRINGKKVIKSEFYLDRGSIDRLCISEEDQELQEHDIERGTVMSFINLFEWIYDVRVSDRVIVLRNIISLYTTSLQGFLLEVDEIFKSTKSNFRFYTEDRVTEFVEMQQEVSNFILETQREFSSIQRDLSNSLGQDLFRVFGFVVVSWAGILLQINKLADIRTALGLSLIPVTLYLGLGLRSVYGLGQQFDSLERSRDKYYSMYRTQIDDNILDNMVEADNADSMNSQFTTDKCLYYLIFGGLLILSLYLIVDLLVVQGPFADQLSTIIDNIKNQAV